MSAPVFVTFRRMPARAELEEYARAQAARVSQRRAGVIDCHVLLEPTDAGMLRVVVELTLPGERLVATHETEPDHGPTTGEVRAIPEYRWLHAMHAAFETAGRLLQDHAGRGRAARVRRSA